MPSMCSSRTVAATFCLSFSTVAVSLAITVAIRRPLHAHRDAATVVAESVRAAIGGGVGGVIVLELLGLHKRPLLVLFVEEEQLGRFAVKAELTPLAGDLVGHLLANSCAL